jgi:hypothetical protein
MRNMFKQNIGEARFYGGGPQNFVLTLREISSLVRRARIAFGQPEVSPEYRGWSFDSPPVKPPRISAYRSRISPTATAPRAETYI